MRILLMRIFLLIIFLILTNCTIANVVPLVIEERNNKNNIELIEKLIEEPYQAYPMVHTQ